MSNPVSPSPAAGWYPDASGTGSQRYWDGAAWTDHTAPAAALPQTAPAAVAKGGLPMKTLIISGAIVAVLAIGAIGNAIGGNRDQEPVSNAVELPSATPTPTPTETAVTEPEVAAPAVVDSAYFKSESASHLDDISKDLDDMIVTLDEDGFWRLLSNSVELSFNLGQLQVIEAPADVAPQWQASLISLESSLAAIDAAVADEPYDDVRVAIDGVRAQVEAMRLIINSAA